MSPAGASGVATLTMTVTAELLHGRAILVGSPIGYTGDSVSMAVTSSNDGIWSVDFKGEHSKPTGTGIFRGDTFVGDYHYVRVLTARFLIDGTRVDDRGRWVLTRARP
jgi:hypothetical protein